MIHASAVEYQGKALIFLGPSGAGKSTISQLLAETIEDVQVLADDQVCLDASAGGWTVSDAWPRILRQARNTSIEPTSHCAPLGAVMRLYQAPHPRLVPVSRVDTCVYLFNAFAEFIRRQVNTLEEKKALFASLAVMARNAPGYAFYFDRSTQTVDVIQREMIFG
jgi:energy-coupling factor transporter ATP-binding protein EcfA2